AGRAADWRVVAPGDVGARLVRRPAGGVVVGLEVPAPRLGACVRPALELRGRVQPRRGRRADPVGDALDARDRDGPGVDGELDPRPGPVVRPAGDRGFRAL